MESREQNGIVAIRMFQGEDFLASIEEACRRHELGAAVVLGGIGMLENAELRMYAGVGRYQSMAFAEPRELVSLQGNCARFEGGWHVHVHATLGDKGFAAQSGHLGAGTVKVTAEVFLLRVPFAIHRKKEDATGIMGMTFQ